MKQLMKEHNVTARKLAAKTKVTEAQISRLLSGEVKSPKINTVLSIADYIKCKIS